MTARSHTRTRRKAKRKAARRFAALTSKHTTPTERTHR